jgi:hypothetical protein
MLKYNVLHYKKELTPVYKYEGMKKFYVHQEI